MTPTPPQEPTDDAGRRAEEAAAWCVRFAEGTHQRDEGDAFGHWLAEHPDNAAVYERTLTLWRDIDLARDRPEIADFRREAMNALQRAVEHRKLAANDRGDEKPAGPASVARHFRRRRPWVAAATACMALLIGVSTLFSARDAQVYETRIGERRIVMLEDGTRMTLDAASRINVAMDDDGRRLELVRGRVKLDVARDRLRPLSVLAGGRLTVATGTSFSVELLPNEMRVVLFEGQVEVMREGARKGAVLNPGRAMSASLNAANARIAPTDLQREASWERGQLSFLDEPLNSAVAMVNRSARPPLVIADPEIGNFTVSGVFNTSDTAAFIEGVAALHDIQVEHYADKILLKKRRVVAIEGR